VYLFTILLYFTLQPKGAITPLVVSDRGLGYGYTWAKWLRFYTLPVSLSLGLSLLYLWAGLRQSKLIIPMPFAASASVLYAWNWTQWSQTTQSLLLFDLGCLVVILVIVCYMKCNERSDSSDSLLKMREWQQAFRQTLEEEEGEWQRRHNTGGSGAAGVSQQEDKGDDGTPITPAAAAGKSVRMILEPSKQQQRRSIPEPDPADEEAGTRGELALGEGNLQASNFILDFRLGQLRYLIGKNYRASTLWFMIEFEIFMLLLVLGKHSGTDHDAVFAIAPSEALYQNFLLWSFVILQAYQHFPAKYASMATHPDRQACPSGGVGSRRPKPPPVEYMVHDEYPMRVDRGRLSLERVIFAWNLTELICWKNRNDDDIKSTTATSHWYQKPVMANQQQQQEEEEEKEEEEEEEEEAAAPAGLHGKVKNADGMGPLKHSPWKIMASWYDSQPEWPKVRLPQRLLKKRTRGGKTSQLEAEWRGDGKWPTRMPHPAGEDDISYSCHVVGDAEFDTRAYLYELEDRVMISFNGSTDWKHLIADLQVGQVRLQRHLEGAQQDECVHEGFNAAFLTMRRGIEHWLGAEPLRHSKPLFLAGFSMGAAMATICARYVAELPQYKGKPELLCLITFGSPCVGNRAFAEQIDPRLGENWRFVCENDLVPQLLQLPTPCIAATMTCVCGCCLCCCCPSILPSVLSVEDNYDHTGTVNPNPNRTVSALLTPTPTHCRYSLHDVSGWFDRCRAWVRGYSVFGHQEACREARYHAREPLLVSL